MRKVALGCFGVLLLGEALWASGEFEEKEKRAPPKSQVLEAYIKEHPHGISVVLGMPTQTWSAEFRGDHLYLDQDARDPKKSCLQLSWQSDDFLKDAAPLMGKVSYLYVVPGHFKTKGPSALAIERVLALLSPWGNFYYKPHFSDLYDTAPHVYLDAFKNDCLPLEIGVKSLPKGEETSYIRTIFGAPIQNLMGRHFEKVTTCVGRMEDARENMYWGKAPLLSGKAALYSSQLVTGLLRPSFPQESRLTSFVPPRVPLVLGRSCEENKEAPKETTMGDTPPIPRKNRQALERGRSPLS